MTVMSSSEKLNHMYKSNLPPPAQKNNRNMENERKCAARDLGKGAWRLATT